MKYVNIAVRNKIARTDEEQAQIVCGNSDYTIKFDFDEEWGAETVKTARFIFASNGKYIDVQFSGDECHMPVISDTTSVLVGVFAGNLCTTTGALIHSIPCITDPGGTPVEPTPDVYAQLMERFNAMDPPAAVLYTAQALTDEQKAQARENIGAADKNATGGGGDAPSGGGGGYTLLKDVTFTEAVNSIIFDDIIPTEYRTFFVAAENFVASANIDFCYKAKSADRKWKISVALPDHHHFFARIDAVWEGSSTAFGTTTTKLLEIAGKASNPNVAYVRYQDISYHYPVGNVGVNVTGAIPAGARLRIWGIKL